MHIVPDPALSSTTHTKHITHSSSPPVPSQACFKWPIIFESTCANHIWFLLNLIFHPSWILWNGIFTRFDIPQSRWKDAVFLLVVVWYDQPWTFQFYYHPHHVNAYAFINHMNAYVNQYSLQRYADKKLLIDIAIPLVMAYRSAYVLNNFSVMRWILMDGKLPLPLNPTFPPHSLWKLHGYMPLLSKGLSHGGP